MGYGGQYEACNEASQKIHQVSLRDDPGITVQDKHCCQIQPSSRFSNQLQHENHHDQGPDFQVMLTVSQKLIGWMQVYGIESVDPFYCETLINH